MDLNFLQKALKAAQSGKKYACATVIEATLKGTPQKSGAKMIVFEDGSSYGTIGGGRYENKAQKECLKAIKRQKPKLITYQYFGQKGQSICGGEIKVYIEPAKQSSNLIICGAGHIALPLSVLAKILDFNVTVIDNRKNLANPKNFGHVDKIIVGNHARRLSAIEINHQTYIMIVTQGNEYDYQCLKAVIKSKAAYIGVISSKLKKIKFIKRLTELNIEDKYLKRMSIPAGIDIGAVTPQEIAVSIMAEIVKIQNKEYTGTDKFKAKSNR